VDAPPARKKATAEPAWRRRREESAKLACASAPAAGTRAGNNRPGYAGVHRLKASRLGVSTTRTALALRTCHPRNTFATDRLQ
jgi:hypothetical protein